MNDEELSSLIRNDATRYQASERLRANVRTQLALQAAARPDPPQLAARPGRRWPHLQWPSLTSGFALGVALTVAFAFVVPPLMVQEPLPDELVAHHVSALKAGALIEVASSDRHTVKPWFQGKLDYAPPVIDLEAAAFPLLGGRIDHLRGGPVAVLAYASHRHMINLFVWPNTPTQALSQAQQRLQRNGFNVVRWNNASMQLWAVSDLDANELDRFAQAWKVQEAAR